VIIAPVDSNLLSAGTVLTSALAFEHACPVSNLFTPDMRQLARWTGQFIVDATNNKSDGTNGGGAWVATLASGTYYGPTAYAQELARAHTAAHGTAMQCIWIQGSYFNTPPTHKFTLTSADVSTLDVLTGPNNAVSALRFGAGYRNQDRTELGNGDFACIHWPHDQVVVDLGTPLGAHASFLVLPDFSPAARVYIKAGDAADFSGSTATYKFTDAAASKLMATFIPAGSVPYRYIGLFIQDPHREDKAQTALGHWWYAPTLDTDRASDWGRVEWEAPSYSRKLAIRRHETRGVRGQPFLAAMEPGEQVTVSFKSAPGISPGAEDAVRSTLASIGTSRLAFVALKPTTDPHRESFLCRVTPSALERTPGNDADARLSMSFNLEVQVVA